MDDIKIPPEVVEAAAIDALFADSLPLSEDYKRHEWQRFTEETREKYRTIARAAIAAGIAAWPGAFPHTFRGPLDGYGFVLPIQEPRT